jgi:hypothetical protein
MFEKFRKIYPGLRGTFEDREAMHARVASAAVEASRRFPLSAKRGSGSTSTTFDQIAVPDFETLTKILRARRLADRPYQESLIDVAYRIVANRFDRSFWNLRRWWFGYKPPAPITLNEAVEEIAHEYSKETEVVRKDLRFVLRYYYNITKV